MTSDRQEQGAPPSRLEVRRSSPADDAARDYLVRAHPEASFFHLSGWRRLVEDVHRHKPMDLLAWRGEELVGVLPLMSCRGPLGRRILLSTPYAVYGGPLAADRESADALVERATQIAREEHCGRLELRCQHVELDVGRGTDLYATFVRELPEEPEQVLTMMPKKARAEARKARKKHGLELTEGVWYVDDLHRLFLLNKHTLGSPALPPRHFRAILRHFERESHVHLVRQGKTPLAAVMSFAFGDTLIAYYSGTRPGADRSASASNFMYMALQEWAVRKGFRRFDFCRSRTDSGAFRFKVHQGFEPQPLHYRYVLLRDSKPPSFTPSNPKTAVLRSLWSKMPLWSARRVSESLARYLP